MEIAPKHYRLEVVACQDTDNCWMCSKALRKGALVFVLGDASPGTNVYCSIECVKERVIKRKSKVDNLDEFTNQDLIKESSSKERKVEIVMSGIYSTVLVTKDEDDKVVEVSESKLVIADSCPKAIVAQSILLKPKDNQEVRAMETEYQGVG